MTKTLPSEARCAKLVEAEALLLESHEHAQQRKSTEEQYRRDALERLVRLCEAWDELSPNTGNSMRAARWKAALEALNPNAPQETAAEISKAAK